MSRINFVVIISQPAGENSVAKKVTTTRRMPSTNSTSRASARGRSALRRPANGPRTVRPAFKNAPPDPATVAKDSNTVRFYTVGAWTPVSNPCLSGGPAGSIFSDVTARLVRATVAVGEHVLVRFTYSRSRSTRKTVSRTMSDSLTITIDSGDSRGITKTYARVAYPPIDDPKR